MLLPRVVGFSGNLATPSKTRGFVRHVASEVALGNGLQSFDFDVQDLGASFPVARSLRDLDDLARGLVARFTDADILVVGSPTYKGSYTGLFKHFFDLLDPAALRGKPVILVATGGGERHSLMVEHQLRPLFGFFEAFALPTAIYASDRDLSEGIVVSEAIRKRVAQSVQEAGLLLQPRRALAAA